jgi:hypothetical protein
VVLWKQIWITGTASGRKSMFSKGTKVVTYPGEGGGTETIETAKLDG